MKRLALIIVGVLILAAVLMFGRGPAGETTLPEGEDTGGSASTSAEASSARSAPSQARARELACGDAADNEADGLTDCDDPDCAGSGECRCSALSCGEEASDVTCRREEGCICAGQNGCVACRGENQGCDADADCCYGTGLTCQEITLGSGVREKRCLPLTGSVCEIACEAAGTWGRPRGCVAATVPPGTEDCAALVGACSRAPVEERNIRRCWQS